MFSDLIKNDQSFYILSLVATVPSIIGSFFMSYYCFKSLSVNTSNKLIFALALSDLLYSVNNLSLVFRPSQGSASCTVQAIFRQLFLSLSICIAISLALLHYKLITTNGSFRRLRFVVISLLFSLTLCASLSFRYLWLQ